MIAKLFLSNSLWLGPMTLANAETGQMATHFSGLFSKPPAMRLAFVSLHLGTQLHEGGGSFYFVSSCVTVLAPICWMNDTCWTWFGRSFRSWTQRNFTSDPPSSMVEREMSNCPPSDLLQASSWRLPTSLPPAPHHFLCPNVSSWPEQVNLGVCFLYTLPLPARSSHRTLCFSWPV